MKVTQLTFLPKLPTNSPASYSRCKSKEQYIIKLQVPTKRAAAMIDVSRSTLCNAKRSGKHIYRKDDMEARYVGKDKNGFLWAISQYR